MVIMIVEKAPAKLKGELTRWMLEPKSGVFVGTMNALVRDRLWEKTVAEMKGRGCMQVYRKNNEQGFEIRMSGDTKRRLVEWDGLQLISTFQGKCDDDSFSPDPS